LSDAGGREWEYTETVHQLFIDFKKARDTIRSEVLYSILIEFGVPMKVVQENQAGLKLNGAHQVLVFTDNANLLGAS
jgi:hypothetical protein